MSQKLFFRWKDQSIKKQAIWKLRTRHISMAINNSASGTILRKIMKMINASASIDCEDPFSSAAPYTEELEQNIVRVFKFKHMHI